MDWDWKIDTFKIMIAGVIGWGGKELVKKFKPFIASVRKVMNIDELDEEVSIIKSKQMAGFHISPDPIFIVNPRGEIIYVNSAWSDVTGIDSKDAHGLWFTVGMHPDNEIEMKNRGEMSITHSSPFFGIIYLLHEETRNKIKTYCRSEMVRDRNNNIIETIGRLSIIV